MHTSLALLLELGVILVALRALGSFARRFAVSPIPFYLLAGLTGEAAQRACQVLAPLRELFAAACFLAIGPAVSPADLLPMLPAAFGLAFVGVVTKWLTGWYAARRDGAGSRGRHRAGTALIVRGEFSVVIIGLASAGISRCTCLADRPGHTAFRRLQHANHVAVDLAFPLHERVDVRLALDLSIEADDRLGQAYTHHNLAWVWERQGRHDQALDHSRQSLALFRDAGHRNGQAMALNGIGWNFARLGEYQRALNYCEHALALFQEIDSSEGAAHTWDSIGYVHHNLDDHERAIACYRNALDLHRELGNRYHEADTLTKLGDTQHAAGNTGDAQDAYRRALTILDEIDHPDAEHVRTKLRDLDSPDR